MHLPAESLRGFNWLQKLSLSLMMVLALVTFVASNLHALLWQTSEWLVSTVLPSAVIELTNQERNENNARPVVRNTVLDQAAKLKAEHMAKNQYFAHFSPDGVSPWHWFDEAGYVYAHAGENLAIHFTDSSEVVEAWMKSPLHRANIVNGDYTEIGVGTAKGNYEGYNTVYVVQLFGTPALSPTVTEEVEVESAPVVPVAGREVEPESVVLPEVLISEEALSDQDLVAGAMSDDQPASTSLAVAEAQSTPLAIPPDVEIETNPPFPPTTEANGALASEASPASDDVKLLAETPLSNPSETSQFIVRDYIPTSAGAEVLFLESLTIATSSGLAVAKSTGPEIINAGATIASIATKPNALLQIVYVILGSLVVFMLVLSIAIEARRFRFVQVAYGVLLLVGMGGLWYVHSLLTTGAVIV